MSVAVTTTVVVDFQSAAGADASSVLVGEVDSREEGFNGGRTSFGPGDRPYVLVFKTADVTLTGVLVSTGSIHAEGSGLYEVTEDLIFGASKSASLSKPAPSGLKEVKWLGNNLGGITLANENEASVLSDQPGVARVKYDSPFLTYRISNVTVPLNGETAFPVVVLLRGTT